MKGAGKAAGTKGRVAPQATGMTAKRVSTSVGSQPSGAKRARPAETSSDANIALRVISPNPKKRDEVGIGTLLGDYIEYGSNHNRKSYQKIQRISGHEEVKVFLYYWDSRDGADFSGWWFGDQVGGTQVWSRASVHSQMPPSSGWRIPWDGPVSKELLKIEHCGKAGAQSGMQQPSAAQSPADKKEMAVKPKPPELQLSEDEKQRIAEAASRVDGVEEDAKRLVDSTTKALASPDTPQDEFEELLPMLKEQTALAVEAQAALQRDIETLRGSGSLSVSSLSKQLARLQQHVRSLQAETNKLKTRISKNTQEMAERMRQAEEQRQQQEVEQQDNAVFQEALTDTVDTVSQAEDAVEAVAIMADHLEADGEDVSEDHAVERMEEIEQAVTRAGQSLNDARKQVSLNLAASKKFSGETKQQAQQEYSVLQKKLSEASTKLQPLKLIREEYDKKRAVKKVIDEISDKLNDAELDIEKSSIMTTVGSDAQMADDEIAAASELLMPAREQCQVAQDLIDKKIKGADGRLKVELTSLMDRAKQARSKCDEVQNVLKQQREGLVTQHMLEVASEKVRAASDCMDRIAEAETPFLTNDIPQEDVLNVVSSCDAAASEAETAIATAKTFIKTKMLEAKRYSKTVAEKITKELKDMLANISIFEDKSATFKRETSRRRMAALVREVAEKITFAEEQVKLFGEVSGSLAAEKLDEVSLESLREAVEKAKAAEQQSGDAVNDARKLLGLKQKEAKETSMVAELTKLQSRLNAATTDHKKYQKVTSEGQRASKSKQVLEEEEKKMKAVDDEVTKAENLATPIGDERLSVEKVEDILTAVGVAQVTLTKTLRSIQSSMTGATPQLKSALTKLASRAEAAQKQLDSMKSTSKEHRERAVAESHVKESTTKSEAVEEMLVKLDEAELPFLKGVEVLPLEEAQSTIEQCEASAALVQKQVSDARTFIAAKTLEVRRFSEVVSKQTATQLSKLTERVNAGAQKLSQFRKKTEGRKRSMLMQEAEQKLQIVEAEVKKTTTAAAPLSMQDVGELTAAAATQVCEQLAQLEAVATEKMNEARTFLADRRKEVVGHPQLEEELKKLQTRLSAVNVELAKAKKAASEHEQRFVANKLCSEATQMVRDVEGEVEKVVVAAAPLVEREGDDFMIANRLMRFADTFKNAMKSRNANRELFFSMMCKESTDSLTWDSFWRFVEGMTESGTDDLPLTEEEARSVFKHLDVDKDDTLKKDDFDALFCERFVCVKSVSVTDGFEISSSKTVCKVEPDAVLEAVGEPKIVEAISLTRRQCRVVASGKVGWVSVKGNQGTVYLEPFSPYSSFLKALDRCVDTAKKSLERCSTFLKTKSSELQACSQGPLVSARSEIGKLKHQLGAAQKSLDELRQKVVDAKKKFLSRLDSEKRTQVEAKLQKVAAALRASVDEQLQTLTVKAGLTEKLLEPFAGPDSNAAAVLQPQTVLKDVDNTFEQFKEAVTGLQSKISSHHATLSKAAKGPLHELKTEFSKLCSDATARLKVCEQSREEARQACLRSTQSLRERVAAAFRSQIQQAGTSAEQMFEGLLLEGEDRLQLSTFRQKLTQLDGFAEVPDEHVNLVFDLIEPGGISKKSFLRTVQLYLVCVKQIAVTDGLEIGTSKTVRMLDIDEIVEVLEGPRADDQLQISRARCRVLADSTVGWVTMKGNQGTPFLKEVPKPFHHIECEVSMSSEFTSGSETVRQLQADEALEVLEGPRKEKLSEVSRAKCKATKDGAIGWFTLKSQSGDVLAETDVSLYQCTASIAITDNKDIRNCKVIRKLEVGEVFKVLEGPSQEDGGVTRCKGFIVKDGQEAWVTIKGNAGTVYAEPGSMHYTVLSETPLQKKFKSGENETVRMLEKGEVVVLIDGPKDEKFDPVWRLKGRAVGDSAIGWITLRSRQFISWSSLYKCVSATVIHDGFSVKTSKVVRRLEAGEIVEVLEGPVVESEIAVLRVKAKAEKDCAVGWVTVKGNGGTSFLKCFSK